MDTKMIQCIHCGKCTKVTIDWQNNPVNKVIYDYFNVNFYLCDIDGATHCIFNYAEPIRSIIFETKRFNEENPKQAQLRMLYIFKTTFYRDKILSLEREIPPLYDKKSAVYLIKLPDKKQFDDEGKEVLYRLKPDDKLELNDIVSNEKNKFIVSFKGYKMKHLKTVTVTGFVELISGIKNNLKECYKNNF